MNEFGVRGIGGSGDLVVGRSSDRVIALQSSTQ
jgi:hypothetical protein